MNTEEQFISSNKKALRAPIWDTIGRWSIYLLFGLLPIFFLPFTSFPIAEAKFFLAGALVFVAFGSYLAKILTRGKIDLPKTWIWAALFAFLVLAGASTILSDVTSLSMWGNAGASDSMFSFIIYALALFLVPSILRETQHITRAILIFALSMAVIGAHSILQLFGVFVFPFDFAKQIGFNTIGTIQALAVFLALGLVILAAFFTSFKLSRILSVIFAVTAALLALILVLINFSFVWMGIFIASALMVSRQITNSRKRANEVDSGQGTGPHSLEQERIVLKLNMPLILMIVVAILYFVNPPISSIIQLPVEVRPSLGATLGVSRGTLGSGIDKALLGSGPSTFVYEYLNYKPQDINTTAFWGVRFLQGHSTISSMISTLGILGVVSFSAIFLLFILSALRGLAVLSQKKSQTESIAFISFVGVAFLLLALFFYPINFTHFLFLFLLSGLTISALRIGGTLENIEFSILKTQQRTFAASLIIVVLIVVTIVGLYWQGQKYVASVFHTSAIAVFNQERDTDTAIRRAVVASNLNTDSDAYWRTLTQLLRVRANEILSNRDLASQELQQRYQRVLQNLIQTGQRAARANSLDPINWRQLGNVYKDNIFIIGGADNFAIDNYKEAAKRNPKNPSEYLNIASAYVLSSDNANRQLAQLSSSRDASKEDMEKLRAKKEDQLDSALLNLKIAIELKADYAPAHFLISQVYERQGNRNLAISKTLETRNLNPLDTGVGYQLALLYYLDEQFNNAKTEFERIIGLSETFSNARYFLGLTYERLGNKQGAIDQFSRISELNPDNEEVKQILANLNSGRGALDGIVPPANPPENRIESPVPQTGGEQSEELSN